MPEPSPHFPAGTYIGFDYGHKRLGLASGQTISRTASPLDIIPVSKGINWDSISAIINEWLPAGLVVGMPYTEDGRETPHIKRIQQFIQQLSERYQLPVFTVDEHLSSYAAKDLLSQSTNRRIRELDDTAAAVILQTWLDQI